MTELTAREKFTRVGLTGLLGLIFASIGYKYVSNEMGIEIEVLEEMFSSNGRSPSSQLPTSIYTSTLTPAENQVISPTLTSQPQEVQSQLESLIEHSEKVAAFLRQLEKREADLKYENIYYPAGELHSAPVGEIVIASHYHDKYNGSKTSSGEIFNQNSDICATWGYPLETELTIINISNGRTARCRVKDRGPNRYIDGNPSNTSFLDLTQSTFDYLAPLTEGVIEVMVFPTGHPAYRP